MIRRNGYSISRYLDSCLVTGATLFAKFLTRFPLQPRRDYGV